jgi:hypothetical protein
LSCFSKILEKLMCKSIKRLYEIHWKK